MEYYLHWRGGEEERGMERGGEENRGDGGGGGSPIFLSSFSLRPLQKDILYTVTSGLVLLPQTVKQSDTQDTTYLAGPQSSVF